MTMDKLLSTCLGKYDTTPHYTVTYCPDLDSITIRGHIGCLEVSTTLGYSWGRSNIEDSVYSDEIIRSERNPLTGLQVNSLNWSPAEIVSGSVREPDSVIYEMNPFGRFDEGICLDDTVADNFLRAIEETSVFKPSTKKSREQRPHVSQSWLHLHARNPSDYPISVIASDGHRMHIANISGHPSHFIRGDILEQGDNTLRVAVPCQLLNSLKGSCAIDDFLIYPDGGEITFLANNRIPVHVSWQTGDARPPNHLGLLRDKQGLYDDPNAWLQHFPYEWQDIKPAGREIKVKNSTGQFDAASTFLWRYKVSVPHPLPLAINMAKNTGIHSTVSLDLHDNLLDDWYPETRHERTGHEEERWANGEPKVEKYRMTCHAAFSGKYCYQLANVHKKGRKAKRIEPHSSYTFLSADVTDSVPFVVRWEDSAGGGRMHLLMKQRIETKLEPSK